ncbi:hypothetical protein NW807_11435 [Synechococcus sp. R70.1]|uniref:hypothetical protein n=1 Tax=Synechococcus sp. R70.1 TaxID=2964531 RepID=UPI0039C27F46
MEELEQSLEEEGAEEYPYWGTRPPLLPRRSSARGGLLLGLASAAALVAGLAFWMTLRPQLVVSVPTRDPSHERPEPVYSASLPAQELSLASKDENPPKLPEQVPSQEPRGKKPEAPSARLTAATSPPVALAAGPPPSARVSNPPARIPPPAPPQMKLVGLIHDPGAPKALILVDKVMRQVPVGQTVKGEWRVTSISPHGVAVSNGVRSVTLQLGLPQSI